MIFVHIYMFKPGFDSLAFVTFMLPIEKFKKNLYFKKNPKKVYMRHFLGMFYNKEAELGLVQQKLALFKKKKTKIVSSFSNMFMLALLMNLKGKNFHAGAEPY